VSQKAVNHHKERQKSAGNVGGLGKKASVTPDEEYEHRERDQAENNATAVDCDAAHPFAQIVALCLEDKPFVAKVRYGDVQQAGEQGSPHVTVRHYGIKDRRKQRERAVTEQNIPAADQKVSPELSGRNVPR